MDIFKDEMTPELDKIQNKLKNGTELNEDELKIILLGLLSEEDAHENKQQ